MTEPIALEFDVATGCDHAFGTWTSRASLWWPRSHTISKEPGLDVVFEARPGGRIFERATDGTEHDWGEVVVWEPPHRVTYLWHLFFDRAESTEVEVSFTPNGSGTTVRIAQRGFDRLGEAGPVRRERTEAAWGEIAPRYRAAVAAEA